MRFNVHLLTLPTHFFFTVQKKVIKRILELQIFFFFFYDVIHKHGMTTRKKFQG